MIILGNRKIHEIRHNINPPEVLLNNKTRPKVIGLANTNRKVCRFTKWIVIGSMTALGFFDFYHWTANGVETQTGYIERSLNANRYDPYGAGVPVILGVWWADGGSHVSTYTAPNDWNNYDNFIDVIGPGSKGYTVYCGGYVGAGYAGAGGGYARRNNAPLTRGSSYYFKTANGDTDENCWFNLTGSNAEPTSYAQGPLAGGASNNGGSGASNGGGYYGDVTYSGGYGNGCGCYYAAGGGGAGGPHGNGGAGGQGDSGLYGSGGGGGGGGGASVPTNTGWSAVNGGNNWAGSGGGAGSPYAGGSTAGSGSAGGGGGGGGGWEAYGDNGGNGGNGTEYNNGAWGSGGGGGGGGAGGWGGLWGGGGGGGWYYLGGQGVNNPGRQGILVIYYTPVKASFVPGPTFVGF